MQRILSEHTVSITELRKNPAQYFIDEPVAVLSNNKPAGYMISASLFETLVDQLERQQAAHLLNARFRPSAAELKAIAQKGNQLLAESSADELAEFTE